MLGLLVRLIDSFIQGEEWFTHGNGCTIDQHRHGVIRPGPWPHHFRQDNVVVLVDRKSVL
jgi:hypothetical protein